MKVLFVLFILLVIFSCKKESSRVMIDDPDRIAYLMTVDNLKKLVSKSGLDNFLQNGGKKSLPNLLLGIDYSGLFNRRIYTKENDYQKSNQILSLVSDRKYSGGVALVKAYNYLKLGNFDKFVESIEKASKSERIYLGELDYYKGLSRELCLLELVNIKHYVSIVSWISQSPMIKHTEFRDELIKQLKQKKISREQMLKLGQSLENSLDLDIFQSNHIFYKFNGIALQLAALENCKESSCKHHYSKIVRRREIAQEAWKELRNKIWERDSENPLANFISMELGEDETPEIWGKKYSDWFKKNKTALEDFLNKDEIWNVMKDQCPIK